MPRIPVLGDGQQLVQPVYVGDVASTVLTCLAYEGPGQTLDLVRPEPIAFSDWLQTLRNLQGLPATGVVPIPWSLAHLGATLLGPFMPMARSENLRMLRQGHRADATPWLQFWGRNPTQVQSVHLRGHAPALA